MILYAKFISSKGTSKVYSNMSTFEKLNFSEQRVGARIYTGKSGAFNIIVDWVKTESRKSG